MKIMLDIHFILKLVIKSDVKDSIWSVYEHKTVSEIIQDIHTDKIKTACSQTLQINKEKQIK